MKVRVGMTKYTGHAQCAANAPEVYERDDAGYVPPDDVEVTLGLEEAARIGAGACRERADRGRRVGGGRFSSAP